MDRGARFYKCDLQVHTPRDSEWTGLFSTVTLDVDRGAYAKALIDYCRRRAIGAIAVTDHNDLCLFPFVRGAAKSERKPDGTEYASHEQLVVFPGLELTLSTPPCQALLLFDPDLSDGALNHVWGALGIAPYPCTEAKIREVQRLGTDKDLKRIVDLLNNLCANPEETDPRQRVLFRSHFILLPHVRRHGHQTLIRPGLHSSYAEMPCVGGYIEGRLYKELDDGNREILEGKQREWGSKRIGVFQTSDCREARSEPGAGENCVEFVNLGNWPTWIKWTNPSADALRQACLASASRISHVEPQLPSHQIVSVRVSNSKFLGQAQLELNPQFNAFIGGRGTGKSTLLEYIRWALCDDPRPFDPSIASAEELPDFQKRRRSLIEKTLKFLNATITVQFQKFGATYQIIRSSLEPQEKVKIVSSDGTVNEMLGEQVRREFPIVSYAQKQLSCVGTLPDEILRIVTDPIRSEVSRIDEDIQDVVLPRLKEARQRQLRLEELRLQEHESEQQIALLREQIQSLQSQLGSLSESQKQVISDHTILTDEKQWLDDAVTKVSDFKAVLSTARESLTAIPELTFPTDKPNADKLTIVATALNRLKTQLVEELIRLEDMVSGVRGLDDRTRSAIQDLQQQYASHQTEYNQYVEIAAKSAKQLEDIQNLNHEMAVFGQKQSSLRSQIQSLSSAVSNATESPWDIWIQKHRQRADLLRQQCDNISTLAQHAFRATLKPCADQKVMFESLDQVVSRGRDIRRREEKVRNLSTIIGEAHDPIVKWAEVVSELEGLVRSKEGGALPPAPLLVQADFTDANLRALQGGLELQTLEEIRYVPLQDKIMFEFAFGTRGDGTTEFIPFHEASPGQQATALMRTLLSKEGPPLLIDQPEEDLDNEQIRAIADRISETKHNRQLIFVSHNANIVVNGDAELVVHFDYAPSTATQGVIERTGSIDYEPIKEIITSVIEGGREAFELRREKYGF